MAYAERLHQLGLLSIVVSLKERRKRADLIQLLKVLKSFSATLRRYFQVNKDSARGHSLKLSTSKSHSHCEARLQFSQRVINRRNSLSQEDVDASSVNAFKGRLDKRRRCQMDFFID